MTLTYEKSVAAVIAQLVKRPELKSLKEVQQS